MNRFAGFFRNVSWLVFLVALILSYSYITSAVSYRIDNTGNSLAITDKNTFFFSAVAIFLFVNVACMAFIGMLKKIKASDEGEGLRNRSLKFDLIGWTKGFAAVLNLFMIILLALLTYLNINENATGVSLGYLIYVGPVLLLVWFFYLMKLLGKKRN